LNPTAVANDVGTLDAILKAMYEVISGGKGEARDWERFHTLYAPEARLMVVVSTAPGAHHVRILTAEEFIERVEPIFANEDFWEVETARHTETFGNAAQVLSSYEYRRTPDGPPFGGGTKSVHLFFDGSRWWIVSAIWNTSRSS
jgi:hypothetical protein